MDDQANVFGSELRQARERAGISLSAFAEQVHYSKGFLSKIENGHAAPTPELARACDDLLSANGALVTLAARGHRSRKSSALHGLPAGTRHFTGRQDELRRIALALREPRAVVVLTGMAGVGKTELALRAAWESQASFPDGCLFFDLYGFTPWAPKIFSGEVLDTLLRVLGVPGAEIPGDLDGRANIYRHRLRGKRLLLVFDNAADSTQVWPLLPAEEGCRVIVTSRNRLTALDEAHHEIVDVMPTDEAVRLFRATADDRADTDQDAVAKLVGLCGNLPLAVRIAAARLRSSPRWTVEQLTDRLLDETSRLRELYDGERNVTSAFALSLKSLPEPQQRLFGLLALHPGGDIELPAAAALGGHEPAEAERLLAGLDYAHLITQLPDDRIRLHDLLRGFAIEHVLPRIPQDQQKNAKRNLIDYALRRTFLADELIAPHRYRPALPPSEVTAEPFTDRAAALAWLDREWPTLVTLGARATAQILLDRCWLFPYLLHDYFFLTKLWEPWIESLEIAAAATRRSGENRALALMLNNLGVAQADRGELAKSQRHYREALSLFRALGDGHGTTARSNLAWVDFYLGEHLAAVKGMTVALAAYQRAGADRNAAITLRGIALAETALGRFDDALAHAEQARGEFVALNLDLDVVMTLNCLAWVHFRAGHAAEAADLYQRAVEAGERYGSRYEVSRAQTGLGNVAAIRGDFDLADRHWSQADRFDGVLNPLMVGEARTRNELAAHR